MTIPNTVISNMPAGGRLREIYSQCRCSVA